MGSSDTWSSHCQLPTSYMTLGAIHSPCWIQPHGLWREGWQQSPFSGCFQLAIPDLCTNLSLSHYPWNTCLLMHLLLAKGEDGWQHSSETGKKGCFILKSQMSHFSRMYHSLVPECLVMMSNQHFPIRLALRTWYLFHVLFLDDVYTRHSSLLRATCRYKTTHKLSNSYQQLDKNHSFNQGFAPAFDKLG